MMGITLKEIEESNRIKKIACENCKRALKDLLTPEQLAKFENDFYTVAEGYIFSEKKNSLNHI